MTVQSTQAAQDCQLDSGIDRGSQRYLNAHLLQNYGTSNLGGRRINYRLHLGENHTPRRPRLGGQDEGVSADPSLENRWCPPHRARTETRRRDRPRDPGHPAPAGGLTSSSPSFVARDAASCSGDQFLRSSSTLILTPLEGVTMSASTGDLPDPAPWLSSSSLTRENSQHQRPPAAVTPSWPAAS